MTWQELLNEDRIERHQTSRQELDALRAVVARDLADADLDELSVDGRFTKAYNAALQGTKMVIACCGYRVRGFGAHYVTFQCLRLAMGKSVYKTARFLNKCRVKRNTAVYDAAGRVAESEAQEMIRVAKSFTKKVEKWIRDNYPVYAK
jgi:uncharacterized protein (UPF0332 family)